jgi:hypothetical protein
MDNEEAPLEFFTDAELSALARMLVTMLRIDGHTSDKEQEALIMFAKRVRLGERTKDKDDVDGIAILQPYIDRAGELAVSREDFLSAANTITNEATREAVYAALYDVSASDLIVGQEWELLKLLVDTWDLDVT